MRMEAQQPISCNHESDLNPASTASTSQNAARSAATLRGALVDERGNVVGVVSAKLSTSAALKISGALSENGDYAIKSR